MKDFATNTNVSFQSVQNAVLEEVKSLQNRISEIDARLMKAENETDHILQQLQEHDACSTRLIDTYRKLAKDIKSEKDKIIEQLELQISVLKQGKEKQHKSDQESDSENNHRREESSWV